MRDPLYATTDYRRFLQEALRNRAFQQRDLASAVDRAPSAISLMLSGLRALDPELVDPIARWLQLDAEQTAYFAALVDVDSKSPRARRQAWATIQATQAHRSAAVVSEAIAEAGRNWYFPAILELAQCEGFRPDPTWIAGTLTPPITVEQAEEALRTAVAVGLLVPNDEGALSAATGLVRNPSEVRKHGEYVAEWQEGVLEIARAAIRRFRHNERQVSATVFKLSEAQFERIRARLREMERELVLMSLEPGEPADRVYQLAIQLFPVSLYADSTADHSMFAINQGEPPDIDPDTTE